MKRMNETKIKAFDGIVMKFFMMLLLMTVFLLPGEKVFAAKAKKITFEMTQEKEETTGYFVPGDKAQLLIRGVPRSQVKWTSSKKSVAVVSKKGVVTTKRTGKAVITGKYKSKVIRCRVIVYSEKKYLKEWAKNWVRENIEAKDDDFTRVLWASYYVSHSFAYGSSNSPMEMLKKGKGTCYSGGKLLVVLLNTMGYKAKVRFAAKDDMSRYPGGITFGSRHYNVKVVIQGKNYYVDGTPGSGAVYLSSSKKPLYFYTDWMF